MGSFRLYVGDRKYLTAAGCVSLSLACAVTAGTAYFGTEWLVDRIGPGKPLVWLVVGSGLVAWGASWVAFRAAGVPLIADRCAEDEDHT